MFDVCQVSFFGVGKAHVGTYTRTDRIVLYILDLARSPEGMEGQD